MKDLNKKKKFVKMIMHSLSLSVILILASMLILFAILLFLHFRKDEDEIITTNENEFYKYTYQKIDPQTLKQTSVGFMNLPKKLENGYDYYFDEYTEEEEENGFFNIISDFSITEDIQTFRCSGSCYCHEKDDSDNRRIASTTTITNGVFLGTVFTLVAALSTYMALENSKDSLFNECEKLQEENNLICVFEKEADEKDETISDLYPYDQDCEYMDPRILEAEKTKDPLDLYDLDRYLCYGRCVKRDYSENFDDPELIERYEKKAEKYDCDKIELEVMIQNFDYCHLQTIEEIEFRWMKDELQEWCEGETVEGRVTGLGLDFDKTACVGYEKDKKGEALTNPTVKCIIQEIRHDVVNVDLCVELKEKALKEKKKKEEEEEEE